MMIKYGADFNTLCSTFKFNPDNTSDPSLDLIFKFYLYFVLTQDQQQL